MGVAPIQERREKTDLRGGVGDPRQSIFSPAIGFRACHIMGQIIPGCAIGAVVFTHGSPGTFANVGSPTRPVNAALLCLEKSFMFGCHSHKLSILSTCLLVLCFFYHCTR